MISSKEINYESELIDNITIEDIKNNYSDGFIIWLHGSGASDESGTSTYKCVLEYKSNLMFFSGKIDGNSPNRAMIEGAIEAVGHVNLPKRIYIIAPTQLGYLGAFKGKGVNGERLQELFEKVKEKNCFLTEVCIASGGDMLKKYTGNSQNVKDEKCSKSYIENSINRNMAASEKQNRYKRMIYNECVSKVISILSKYSVDEKIINEINEIEI